MSFGKMRFVFGFGLLAILSNVHATEATQFSKLVCTSADREFTKVIFEGFVTTKNGAFQKTAKGFEVSVRKIQLKHSKIDEPSCGYSYKSSTQVWNPYKEEWEWVDIKKSRNWNSIEVLPVGSMTFLSCGPGSQYEIFDTKSDWLEALAQFHAPKVPSWVAGHEGWIDSRKCLISYIP